VRRRGVAEQPARDRAPGVADAPLAVRAAGALLHYAQARSRLPRPRAVARRGADREYVALDAATRRNSKSPKRCVASRRRPCSLLDGCATAAGALPAAG
jgi:hypothetical protein